MTTIKTTLDNALPAGAKEAYPVPYSDVLEALVNRDYELTDAIVTAVHERFGISKETVQGQLEGIGMAVRPAPAPPTVFPTPAWDAYFTPQDSAAWEVELTQPAIASATMPSTFIDTESLKKGKKGKKNSVKALAKQVKKLTKIARQHGMTI